MQHKFVLKSQAIRQRATEAVLSVPDGMEVVIRSPTRNLEQNARLHAMLGDLAGQVEWKGMKLSQTVWKRLCTSAMLRELGESPDLIPALDGHGVDIIYEKTSHMSKKMLSALIDWVAAFGDEHGVVWSDPNLPQE